MGFEIPGQKLGTQRAGADLSDARYRFVALTTTSAVVRLETAGGAALGVLQSPANDGEATEVMVTGVSKVIAGAAIADTGPVTSDTQGRAIAASTAGHSINGIALETAAAAGEVIAVLNGYRGVVPAE